jgi:predicted unusual protein kinase regulating ubiquinone biosynthesis (AarF/ABC1/UbiB family)
MEGTSIVHYMTLQPLSSELIEVDPVEKLKLKLSDLGCRLILKMVFFDNFIHGDLHPGIYLQLKANAIR